MSQIPLMTMMLNKLSNWWWSDQTRLIVEKNKDVYLLDSVTTHEIFRDKWFFLSLTLRKTKVNTV